MYEPSPPAADDEGGLGALLVLLNGAADSFRTVQVTYRTWRHEQRLQEAFRAKVEKQKRRGVYFAAVHSGGAGPAETGETVRIWRDGQRVRQEHHGGLRDGSYGVVDGPKWWSWSEQMGAMSNQGDASIGGGIDRGFEVMLDPASLVSLLDLRVTGNSHVASRATITAHAAPLPEGLSDVRAVDYPRAFRTLHALGTGADSYHLEVDQECGVLLATTALRGGQPFYKITTLAIRFDEPIPAETFQFRPPEGEQIRSPEECFPRPQFVPLANALRRVAFTVLVPARLPTGWAHLPYCACSEASSRRPAYVVLIYRSDPGRRQVVIQQMAAGDAPQNYGDMLNDKGWQEVLRDGTPIKIRPAGERAPAQAHVTRNGTFAYLSSEGLTTDELAMIAASLRPASETDDA